MDLLLLLLRVRLGLFSNVFPRHSLRPPENLWMGNKGVLPRPQRSCVFIVYWLQAEG